MADRKTIKKTKLIKLLSSFSTLEWKRFGRFVQSPYHNSNQKVIRLYEYLKNAFPFDNDKALEQDRIYKKVYGDLSFKPNNLQSLCSLLYGLASDFVIDVHLQKENRKREKILIDALSERNYELFKGASQQLIKEVETQEYFLDEEDFLLLYQLNGGLHFHIEKDKFTIQKPTFEKSWSYLNAFYTNINLQYVAENRGAQNILNQNKNLGLNFSIQLTKLFEEIVSLHKTKKSIIYFQLKDKLLKNWDKLKTKHKTNLLVHLLNFSLTNSLINKEFGYSEAMSLYKIGLKDKLFIINGRMRDIEFINISVIGFKYESEEWGNNFIKNYQKYLNQETKSFLVPLAYSYNAIFQNDYERVVELLRDVKPLNNLLYLSKIKMLLIRAYFEGIVRGNDEYHSLIYYEMKSSKKMMERNDKLSSLKVTAMLNFLELGKQLLDLHIKNNLHIEELLAIEKLMSKTQPLELASWLKEKLIDLKNAVS